MNHPSVFHLARLVRQYAFDNSIELPGVAPDGMAAHENGSVLQWLSARAGRSLRQNSRYCWGVTHVG
jgi:hypothetical protein